ncbi:hypothetical protein M1M25_gp052 [Tenacibaculum phage Gundel_1]|uniref:Uncharacterized protein n=1 Tax=Tenacibaculum phage Gundel_1 TaxID=2745672 RepID=A0A8E4ZL34_9CAUD|nr:hypothetical protein M1M25_gp052 [Tenacibaculum phage Gundel_1]QQV91486.1 hypothetical protein Gundel1_52 [Tenacibaculum phage Gundel_1]
MRHLIIRLFFLSYLTRFLGITFRFTRLAPVIVPLICLGGYLSIKDKQSAILYSITALIVIIFYVPNYYLKKTKIRLQELNNDQKWFFIRRTFIKKIDYKQVESINYKMKINNNKYFYNVVPFLFISIPPTIIILLLIF